jgi:protein transport protein SEC23
MDAFQNIEDSDGIRLSWNVWPTTPAQEQRMVVPVGALYTPLKRSTATAPTAPAADGGEAAAPVVLLSGPQVLPHAPMECKNCGAVLNPYASVDVPGRLWTCPFCIQRNPFPHNYAHLTHISQVPEVAGASTTVEYRPAQSALLTPAFLFVVDVCSDHLADVKDALLQAVALLPEKALVGLITVGSSVHVYELSFELCPKAYVFHGAKIYKPDAVARLLGIGATGHVSPASAAAGSPSAAAQPTAAQMAAAHNPHAVGGMPSPAASASVASGRRFLMPISECQFTLESILEDLQQDPHPVQNSRRPRRCTGTALCVASGLLRAVHANSPGRIMTFVG